MSVRRLKLPVAPPHHCRWCEQPITLGRNDRTMHDGRADEPDCKRAWILATDRTAQWNHVAGRDGERCKSCGEAPMKWLRGGVVFIGGMGEFIDRTDPRCAWVCGTRYCEVTWTSALELEHDVPLWSIAHLEFHERKVFFGPSNLRLLCQLCHKPKTRAEAGARAKTKRQTKLRLDVPREPPKNPIKSRGFQKGHRPLKSRNTFATRRPK